MARGRTLGTGRVYGQAAVARDIEEGHTEASPVVTYRLSPEELEKYRKLGKEKQNGAKIR